MTARIPKSRNAGSGGCSKAQRNSGICAATAAGGSRTNEARRHHLLGAGCCSSSASDEVRRPVAGAEGRAKGETKAWALKTMLAEEARKQILECLENHPLLAFSMQTQIQADAVTKLGSEIQELAKQFTKPDIAYTNFRRAHDLFWFWVLGAYEVLRTMDQNGKCFVPELSQKIKLLKRRLAKVRIPFAKQEMNGKGGAIGRGEIAISGFTLDYEIKGAVYDGC